MKTVYTFNPGETIILSLDCLEGEPATVTQIDVCLRQMVAPHAVEQFQVTARADGWTLTIDAAVSATMALGIYEAKGTILVPGQTVITESVQVRLK